MRQFDKLKQANLEADVAQLVEQSIRKRSSLETGVQHEQ